MLSGGNFRYAHCLFRCQMFSLRSQPACMAMAKRLNGPAPSCSLCQGSQDVLQRTAKLGIEPKPADS